jgi:antitoxin component YwqK of YwqJK toxin-antitoxin module
MEQDRTLMRVNIDDTDSDDGSMRLYQGVPFTGEVVETDGDGNLVYLNTYNQGFEAGPYREWYPGGGLRAEGQVELGKGPVGVWRQWYRNGQLSREDVYGDAGGLLRRRGWTEDGTLVDDRSFPARDNG